MISEQFISEWPLQMRLNQIVDTGMKAPWTVSVAAKHVVVNILLAVLKRGNEVHMAGEAGAPSRSETLFVHPSCQQDT
jgi:hypothetical protein